MPRLCFPEKHAVSPAALTIASWRYSISGTVSRNACTIVPGGTPSDVTAKATQILNATGIRNATITVTPNTFSSSTATVTVEIRTKYADNSWLKPVFLANSDMYSAITLDHENKAYLLAAGTIGNNNNEPIDH